MPRPIKVEYRVYPDPEQLALQAAVHFATIAEAAIALRGVARIAISGGNSPRPMFQLLADPSQPLPKFPWQQLHLYWVDERCVPPDDKDSNYHMTHEALLSKVPLPEENIHRMEGELPPEEAANRYESVLRNSFRLEGAELPSFDLVLLGMGDDGHTASLFPHTPAIHELGRLVTANHIAQKDTWRITLTWPVINQGREVAFLIEGADKAEILRQVLFGDRDPETLPSQLIRPANGRLLFLLDEDAAANLPEAPDVFMSPLGTVLIGETELAQ